VSSDEFSLGAIILAAGRSSRMGRPKLLLDWGPTSVLGHLIEQWNGLGCAQIAVVCAGTASVVEAELDRLSFPQENRISNPDPDRGMFSSIVCATQWSGWVANPSHFAIVLGDQPHLRGETLEKLLSFARGHPESVCQPSRNQKQRHPVILPKDALFRIPQSGARNLKEFLASCEVAACECDDAGLDLDMDRPEDYLKALELAGLAKPGRI
jgi:CTP:molybdopterin cytidylyltransferase MocA